MIDASEPHSRQISVITSAKQMLGEDRLTRLNEVRGKATVSEALVVAARMSLHRHKEGGPKAGALAVIKVLQALGMRPSTEDEERFRDALKVTPLQPAPPADDGHGTTALVHYES